MGKRKFQRGRMTKAAQGEIPLSKRNVASILHFCGFYGEAGRQVGAKRRVMDVGATSCQIFIRRVRDPTVEQRPRVAAKINIVAADSALNNLRLAIQHAFSYQTL